MSSKLVLVLVDRTNALGIYWLL